MKEYIQINKISVSAIMLWLIVFSVYLRTLAPAVGFIDSGELSAVAMTLGIAHPTGYPLFTLLCRVFSMLPIGGEEIVRLNLFSALLTSIAASVFFFFLLELFKYFKKEKNNSILFASSFSVLILAFSKSFWTQAVSIEVYSLHLLLISLILFLFVKAINKNDKKIWVFFAFLVGLSFTNHLTTILLAPALMYWFFAEFGITKNAFKKMLFLIPSFLAGISVYLYLPIRASQSPLLNWGNPQSIEKFWWHFTGKQFRVWMFSSGDAARKQLNYFSENLSNEFHFIILIIAVVGFFILLFSSRRIFVFTLLLFVSCVLYAINYDIHDIDSYFLLAFISLAIFVSIGTQKILDNFEGKLVNTIAAVVMVGLVSVQLVTNYTKVDLSNNYLVEDYTNNILLNLPKNSIVLSYQWDYFVSASYYLQHVKNIRPDVIVLDKELFRRSWYFSQLKKMHPTLMDKSKQEVELFQQELFKFEHELPYDFSIIEGRYSQMLKSFIEKSESVHFYITPEIELQYTIGYNKIPEGLLFRLMKDTAYSPAAFPKIQFRNSPNTDVYSLQIKKLTIDGMLRREMYEKAYDRDSLAILYNQKALEISSMFQSQVSKF
ncbi:MAG: DUF2723 domain-containing protein [Bacteroidota bacterium]|nr:DUF2723 domain-containing protein [Bacteroidota bacterium]